jgi:hypothetical protein
MSEYFYQNLEEAILPLICLFLPGILLTLNGLRTIRNRKTLSVGLDSHFHWEKPTLIKGKLAVNDGKFELGIGIFLFAMGILALIGVFS